MAVIHGLVVSFSLLLADSQPVTSYNPTATLWVTCRHEKICICNTRCCKSIFVIYSPLTSVNTNYRVSKFNWKCLCWFRISISPLLLCYAKSTPVFSTAATRCSNIHTWYRNIINCICFTRTSIVANTRNCCKYIWKFEGKSYIWSTCIVSKSPLFTRPQGRYKVCRRNSYSNNQKRLLLLSNLRDDNGRYFQWCCCEHYLQRHNTL